MNNTLILAYCIVMAQYKFHNVLKASFLLNITGTILHFAFCASNVNGLLKTKYGKQI
jgi:hypothetical protein